MKNPENWDMFEAFTVVFTFSGLFQQCDSKQPQPIQWMIYWGDVLLMLDGSA